MGRSGFEALGIPRETAQKMVDAYNESDSRAMVEVADTYDLEVPPTENAAYVAAVRHVLGPRQEELGREMRAIRDGEAREAAG